MKALERGQLLCTLVTRAFFCLFVVGAVGDEASMIRPFLVACLTGPWAVTCKSYPTEYERAASWLGTVIS